MSPSSVRYLATQISVLLLMAGSMVVTYLSEKAGLPVLS